MLEDLRGELSERRLARKVAAIGGQIHARQHDLLEAQSDQPPCLIHDRSGAHAAGISAAVRNDAERTAVVAAVLHLQYRPRTVLKYVSRIDEGRRGLLDRH